MNRLATCPPAVVRLVQVSACALVDGWSCMMMEQLKSWVAAWQMPASWPCCTTCCVGGLGQVLVLSQSGDEQAVSRITNHCPGWSVVRPDTVCSDTLSFTPLLLSKPCSCVQTATVLFLAFAWFELASEACAWCVWSDTAVASWTIQHMQDSCSP